ncbi:pigment-dispersing hormone peptides [Apis florea]|uniref:pigment-dispersing hormone peptides n=1 Tax=Apis florea TaxID=7463 RepID=UPI000252B038|nr:pigment-dispersing hormone peptides [Apis florea]XP_012339586.1 pigment-dispersing hormone peptides [Apis florea]XP_012339587.1 pigment-dispersing hormone peptides [Apis florea]
MISRKCVLILIMMLGIVYQTFGTTEDSYRNLLALNFPYDRGVNNDLQRIAKLLLFPPCLCHSKRNSELINSLLGLPKNMNNAGK